MIVFLLFHLNSSFPGQRYLPFSLYSTEYSTTFVVCIQLYSTTFPPLFALLNIPSLPWVSKRTSKDKDCMVYLADCLPRKSHLVHKRLQTGELQKEMSSASTRRWVTETASFSIKSYQEEPKCLKALLSMACC